MRKIFTLIKNLFIRNPRASLFCLASSTSLSIYNFKKYDFHYVSPFHSFYRMNRAVSMNANQEMNLDNVIHVFDVDDDNHIDLEMIPEHRSIELNTESDFRSIESS